VSRWRVDAFYRTSRPINFLGDTYDLQDPGAAVRFGVPFSEYDTVYMGLGWERTELGTSVGLPLAWLNYRALYGNKTDAFALTLGWARDGRDSLLVPSAGRYQRVFFEWSAAGEVRYLKTNLQYQEYWSTATAHDAGAECRNRHRQGPGRQALPGVQELLRRRPGHGACLRAGLAGRGGPHRAYIGGARRFNVNAELYFPVPGTGNDRTLRIFAFTDAGNVWREDEKVTASSLRVSAGLGLSWISPVGPLKLSWGAPVRVQRNDRIQRFQFQIGTAF
jgi:outer membrane protein insertion porin family